MLTVLCVLKSGGVYGPEYVRNLRAMVEANLRQEYYFVAMTDMDLDSGSMPLIRDWPGWWSKIEAFRMGGRVIYIDLDTSIFGDLTPLVDALKPGNFFMLKPFNRREKWASGIMAWDGDFGFIFREMTTGKIAEHNWDQRYILDRLTAHKVDIRSVQDVLPDVYSYKWHCKGGVPEDARIVCFHGKPKPHEVGHPYWIIK